jgi:hypothetical protein
MKRFLLVLATLVVFSGAAFVCLGDECDTPTPAPTVSEAADNSTTSTLETALQYVDSVVSPIMQDIGPRADEVMYNFQAATSALRFRGVDVTELTTLGEEAMESYVSARTQFYRGMTRVNLGGILANEAKDLTGAAAYALRVEAAAYYYKATINIEEARTMLDTVLEIGEKGKTLTEKLVEELEDEDVDNTST